MAKRDDTFISITEARKRKKKKEAPKKDTSALDKQVINEDTITIADVKQFIADARKDKSDYKVIADRSWNEIERRNQKDGKLYGVNNVTRQNRWAKFPLWWSCLKIRQPITLARLPIPILKDTQGDDPFGRTACVVGERLTRGILKTFDALPEFCSSVDDLLVTNFGWGRVFYKMEECSEPEKVRLQVIQPPPPQPQQENQSGPPAPTGPPPQPIFLTPDGQQVDQSQVLDDEFGPYLLTGNEITVDNEEVYFEAQLYSNLYTERGVRRWNKFTKVAYEYQYTYREFEEKFGQEAIGKLSIGDIESHKDGTKPIIMFEYWDKFYKECRWFAENSEDFFQPLDMQQNTDDLEEVDEKENDYDNSDLYGLTGFFPCTEPLIINQSTKHFWPTPEYFQVSDILDDTSSIFGRMVQLTKAIRIRFFFDSSCTQLAGLIGENWTMGEGNGIGIPNLQQILMNNQGDLSALVAYFPVKDMVDALAQMYQAFQQRLDTYYRVTGISDLIQGQTNPDSDKTFGERQMEGKFALNRMEPYQRKVQEWIKAQYQLLMEMGLKMFSDKTLDEYITPQTLEDDDKQRYEAALELLKDNKRRRFRVDFETDSTIAINQDWRKQNAIEAANTISKMMESIAQVAESQPELAGAETELAMNVVRELTDGKLIFDKVQKSLEQVIEKISQPKPPPFDKDAAANDLAKQQLQFDQEKQQVEDQFDQAKLASDERIQMAKIQQQGQQANITNQLKQLQMGLDTGRSHAELQQQVTKLQADIAQGWESLNIAKENMLLVAQKEGGAQNIKAFEAQIEARAQGQEVALQQADQGLKAMQLKIDAHDMSMNLAERAAQEVRLQAEHAAEIGTQKVEAAATLLQAVKPEPAKASPISVDLSKTVHIKPPAPPKAMAKPKEKKK